MIKSWKRLQHTRKSRKIEKLFIKKKETVFFIIDIDIIVEYVFSSIQLTTNNTFVERTFSKNLKKKPKEPFKESLLL